MKNKFNLLILLTIAVAVVLGCNAPTNTAPTTVTTTPKPLIYNSTLSANTANFNNPPTNITARKPGNRSQTNYNSANFNPQPPITNSALAAPGNKKPERPASQTNSQVLSSGGALPPVKRDAGMYHLGPRGGCFTYTSGGNKRYVDRSFCH